MEREYFGEVRGRDVRELPNWGTLNEVLGKIAESESLLDYIKKEMERLKSEGYVDTVDEGIFREREVGPSSAINTYPGVPVGCTPIFLAVIPKPEKGDLWEIVPGVEFYARVLSEFALWVEGCNKFDLRFISIISEREPDETILRPRQLRHYETILRHFLRHLRLIRSIFHKPIDMMYFSNLISDLIIEFHENIDIIISIGLYDFLYSHWNYPFSWYIKDKNKLVYFDGVTI